MMLTLRVLLFFSVCAFTINVSADLSDNIRINSKKLGYELQYRVYTPKNYHEVEKLPVIYVTDGPMYIEMGRLISLLDVLIEENKIEPVIAVFVDPRNPENLKQNRRSYEFLCNTAYYDFYVDELVPKIDGDYKTAANQLSRTILGLSFGGLNSACFGLLASETFHGIGMLSPAMHPMPKIFEFYEQSEKLPLKFFLSTGTVNDNEKETRRFKRILKRKGYPLKYKEVERGHNWSNWRPLLDDVLLYFYGRE